MGILCLEQILAISETCSVLDGRTMALGRTVVLEVDHSEKPCSSRSSKSILTASGPSLVRISSKPWDDVSYFLDVSTSGIYSHL